MLERIARPVGFHKCQGGVRRGVTDALRLANRAPKCSPDSMNVEKRRPVLAAPQYPSAPTDVGSPLC